MRCGHILEKHSQYPSQFTAVHLKKFLQVCLIPPPRAPITVAETDPTKLNSKNASSQNKPFKTVKPNCICINCHDGLSNGTNCRKADQKNRFTNDLISHIPTSAGNLFKFFCRASTEYQIAVSD